MTNKFKNDADKQQRKKRTNDGTLNISSGDGARLRKITRKIVHFKVIKKGKMISRVGMGFISYMLFRARRLKQENKAKRF